jgi:hypothetical protein
VLLAVAAVLWVPAYRGEVRQSRADGVVTEVETRQDASGELRYGPHVRFRLPDGRIVQTGLPVVSEPEAYTAGETFQVLYDRGDPAGTARVGTRTAVFRRSIVSGVTGAILFDVGCVFWIVLRRREILRGDAPGRAVRRA